MHNRTRDLRRSLGLTQKEFGEKIGVSRDVMANIENNRVVPSETQIKLVCATFGVSYDWLKNGEGDMFPSINPSLTSTVLKILEGENETAKAVFTALAAFGDEEWAMVQKFIDSLK